MSSNKSPKYHNVPHVLLQCITQFYSWISVCIQLFFIFTMIWRILKKSYFFMLNKMLKNIKELLSLARFLCSFILQNHLNFIFFLYCFKVLHLVSSWKFLFSNMLWINDLTGWLLSHKMLTSSHRMHITKHVTLNSSFKLQGCISS